MASTLYCDPDLLGREQCVYKRGILGSESPLEFEDGHAIVEDEEAADLLVRRSAVEYAGAGNDGDPHYFDESEPESDTTQTLTLEEEAESDPVMVDTADSPKTVEIDPVADDSDEPEPETCAATTASGDPCSNPAGPDGYCHLESHGPE